MTNLSAQDKEKLDSYNGMTVGRVFKNARTQNGYDLMQIAAHLGISSTYLEAIEEGDVHNYPPKVYCVGFVRSYADLLELDAEKMAYLFKVQTYGKKETDEHKAFVKPEGKKIRVNDIVKTPKQKAILIIGGLVSVSVFIAFVVIVFMWIVSLFTATDDDAAIIPEVPASLSADSQASANQIFLRPLSNDSEDKKVEPMDILVRPDKGGKSYGGDMLQSPLAFKTSDKVFVEIRDVKSGNILISKNLNKGDVFYIQQGQDILLSTNNGGGISAYLDGELLGVLAEKGQEVRMRPFSIESLRLQKQR